MYMLCAYFRYIQIICHWCYDKIWHKNIEFHFFKPNDIRHRKTNIISGVKWRCKLRSKFNIVNRFNSALTSYSVVTLPYPEMYINEYIFLVHMRFNSWLLMEFGITKFTLTFNSDLFKIWTLIVFSKHHIDNIVNFIRW